MIRITEHPIDPVHEQKVFEKRADNAGAVVSFLGKVRKLADGQPVVGLYLEHFPGVTEKSIAAIETQARARWALDDVAIIHRTGEVEPGGPIVLVCTASAHRRDAFEAADFVMDYLKSEAVFWKKERRADGDFWIEPRDQDYNDIARWRVREQQE